MPVVQLELDSKGAITSLQRFDNAADASARNIDSAFGKVRGSINNVAESIVQSAVAIGAAIVTIGAFSLNSAARMQEAQNKYDVVFAGMEESANAWVANLRNAYGVSEKAAKDYLSSTKAVLDGTQMETKAAAELSNQMVILAQDLASFHDKTPEQAVMAMTAALTGEMEMMKQYGIVIKAEEVTQRALEQNHLKSAKAITEAMKAQAAYTLILEKSGKAGGDVARSQESYTFQLKQAKANIEDMSVAIGEKLIPVATDLLKTFNEWVKGGDRVAEGLYWIAEGVRFVHNGISGLILIADALVVGMANLHEAAFTPLLTGMKEIVLGFSSIGDAMVKMGLVENNPFVSLAESIEKTKQGLSTFATSARTTFNEHIKTIETNNKAYDAFQNKIKGVTEEEKKLIPAVNGVDEALKNQNKTLGANKAAIDNTVKAMSDMNQAIPALRNNNGVWEQTAGHIDKINQSVNTLSKTFKSNFTDEGAEEFIKLKNAVDSAEKAVEEHSVTLKNDATPAALKYHEALQKLANSAKENFENFGKVDKAAKDTDSSMKGLRETAVTSTSAFYKVGEGAWMTAENFKAMGEAAEEAANKIAYGAGVAKSATAVGADMKVSGSFSARGELTEEQWKSLPKDVQDRLAKQAMNMPSTFDYFSNPTGQRFKGPDYEAVLKYNAESAMSYETLKNNQTSDLGRSTVINNFNQQISRSDVTQIVEESNRSRARA